MIPYPLHVVHPQHDGRPSPVSVSRHLMRFLNAALAALLLLHHAPLPAVEEAGGRPDHSTRVEAMKVNPRGPFARIRWFCKDGSVLPPEPSACKPHGGGEQYGEWTDEVKRLRADGWLLANVLAAVDIEAFARHPQRAERLGQMLIEQFLIGVDDGWILRKARYYRGAFQSESEAKAGQRLLEAVAGDGEWLARHWALMRAAVALLPHGADSASARLVRQQAADLSARDPAFLPLRNKIHGRPAADDAAAVRRYAEGLPSESAATRDLARQLADGIEALYRRPPVAGQVRATAEALATKSPRLAADLEALAAPLEVADSLQRLQALGKLMAFLRDLAPQSTHGAEAVRLLDLSRAAEDEYFRVAAADLDAPGQASREARMQRLGAAAAVLYGAGLCSQRQQQALESTVAGLGAEPTLVEYRDALHYLSLAPAWGSQWMSFHFGDAVERYLALEPLTGLFVQDQLRGGPLFAYAQVIDGLLRDVQQLAGVPSELLGTETGGGLRALNPGLARGVLRIASGEERIEDYQQDAIYLLPETVSELPPLAGILTAGEGNPLSHVQLLARNLGIPNVGVDSRWLDGLRAYAGRRIVLAVSAAGAVRIAEDGPQWDAIFDRQRSEAPDLLIEPDLERLQLGDPRIIPLDELRASDSGAMVGPKAAKLGELMHHYPEAVAPGLALPFALFRTLLEQPWPDKGMSTWAWMTQAWREADALPRGSSARAAAEEAIRADLERWALQLEASELKAQLREEMTRRFGAEGSYGVFVRSDTNVEDLAGFTGAGLNLTLPNVVGFDEVMAALPRVWASPFSARAFAWRQSHMSAPEHVYVSVLLLKTVPAEKSGVLVTRDVDSGSTEWLSVAVNEGIGGAVDGQAAESLRIHVPSGAVRVLAEATARERRVALPSGGLARVPVSGRAAVLEPEEIRALVAFSRDLPSRFPPIEDAEGQPAAADVEFAFVDGRLQLLQIRPFLESAKARRSSYLAGLDGGWSERGGQRLRLAETLGSGLLQESAPDTNGVNNGVDTTTGASP
jgi:hypothetical protein